MKIRTPYFRNSFPHYLPLPLGPRGSVTLAVEFALSAECLLTVTAREVSKNIEVKATFSTRDTPEVVKARLERNNRIAAAVKAAQVKMHSKPQLVPVSKSWFGRLKERLFGA